MLNHLLNLIYPPCCIHCSAGIADEDVLFCAACMMQISFTPYSRTTSNEMVDRLVSIACLKSCYAPLFFKKEGVISNIFYKIKYKNRPDLARRLGEFAALQWLDVNDHQTPDVVTFVPIHPTKEAKRGYNQSEVIAGVVAERLGKPCISLLRRTSSIDTQTHLGRYARLQNQQNTIRAIPRTARFKHILLVDDILTTGATVETCYVALRQKNADFALSLLTLAVADAM